MNDGFSYVLALFCLFFVSMSALFWQQQLMHGSVEINNAWSQMLAEQVAMSGIEYGIALAAHGNTPAKATIIQVPEGTCRLTFTRLKGSVQIKSEGMVKRQGRNVTCVRFFQRSTS